MSASQPNLEYIPHHQRAALVFVDMQIADLDAQRERLANVRNYLAGLSALPEAPTMPAVTAAVAPASDPDEEALAEPEPIMDYDTLKTRIREFLGKYGLTRTSVLALRLDVPREAISYVITRNRAEFIREGERRAVAWRLRADGEAEQIPVPIMRKEAAA